MITPKTSLSCEFVCIYRLLSVNLTRYAQDIFFFDDDLKEEPKTHYNDIYQRKQAAAPTCLAVQLNCMGGKSTRTGTQVISFLQSSHTLDRSQKQLVSRWYRNTKQSSTEVSPVCNIHHFLGQNVHCSVARDLIPPQCSNMADSW